MELTLLKVSPKGALRKRLSGECGPELVGLVEGETLCWVEG